MRRSRTDARPPTDPDVGWPREAVLDPQDAALDLPRAGTRTRALVAIGAIITIEAAFVVLDIAFGERQGFPDRLKVTRHLGAPEVFVYLQWLFAAGLMWRLRAQNPLYGIWAFVLVYRFVGDFFEFHRVLERLLNPGALRLLEPFGSTPAIKEVMGHVVDESTLILLVLLTLVAIGRRQSDPVAAQYSRRAIALQGLYVVFLVLGEWLFLFLIDDRRVAGILEEGGEMWTGSLIFGLALLQTARLSSGRELLPAVLRSRIPRRPER